MQAILTALDEQHSELAALLDPLDGSGWQRPTRCEGWSVADVVLHLAQTDELALASTQDRFTDGIEVLAGGLDRQGNVDDGAAAMVERERGLPELGAVRAVAKRRGRPSRRASRRAIRTGASRGSAGQLSLPDARDDSVRGELDPHRRCR